MPSSSPIFCQSQGVIQQSVVQMIRRRLLYEKISKKCGIIFVLLLV